MNNYIFWYRDLISLSRSSCNNHCLLNILIKNKISRISFWKILYTFYLTVCILCSTALFIAFSSLPQWWIHSFVWFKIFCNLQYVTLQAYLNLKKKYQKRLIRLNYITFITTYIVINKLFINVSNMISIRAHVFTIIHVLDVFFLILIKNLSP